MLTKATTARTAPGRSPRRPGYPGRDERPLVGLASSTNSSPITREIERLLTDLQRASESRAREQLSRRFAGVMGRHLDVEEACLDPALRQHVTGGGALAAKGCRDRDEIADRLHELRTLEPDDDRFRVSWPKSAPGWPPT
ncbi:hemerythrin domain-containing protein [Yinghuangia aomiensis]